MSVLDLLRPKWKHSNWEVRRGAIGGLYSLKELKQIAQKDKHQVVREEALKRLSDPELFAELAFRRRSLLLAIVILFVFVAFSQSFREPANVGGQYQPPINSSSLAFVESIVDGLDFGNIAFNTPSGIPLGEATTIELLLSCEASVDQLKKALRAVGEREGYRIRIANDMQAHLWGRGFECKAIVPQEQVISPSHTTQWRWDVEAIEGGAQTLHLTISTILYLNDHAAHFVIKTFERNIQVKVKWRQQLASFTRANWQWMCTVMLIPIIAWGTKKWSQMRMRSRGKGVNTPRIIWDAWKDRQNE
jgi:hypothetical protein